MKRFVDLTAEETSDLWLTAQKIGKQLEHHHKASSLTFTIQVRWLQFTNIFQNVYAVFLFVSLLFLGSVVLKMWFFLPSLFFLD